MARIGYGLGCVRVRFSFNGERVGKLDVWVLAVLDWAWDCVRPIGVDGGMMEEKDMVCAIP